MNDQIGDENESVADMFGDHSYDLAEHREREFKPWHRPRKQFVRREQWIKQIQRLFDDRDPCAPIRYLGLPGTDLVELRYLHDKVCIPTDRKLIFLGFCSVAHPNSAARHELDISLYQLNRLPNVHEKKSRVLHDDFRCLSATSSIAWQRAKSLGPFDVVNVDLCDGLATDSPTESRSLYNALAHVTTLQGHNLEPWLLLITTRIGVEQFNRDAEAEILERFRDNICNCDGFADECQQHLGLDATTIDSSDRSDTDYLKLMIVALGKWLAKLIQATRGSKVVLASILGYKVAESASCEDLVSFALRCEPITVPAQNALSPTPPQPFDECEIAKGIVRRTAKRKDVDLLLKGNVELQDELIAEMEDILHKAGYDISEYRRWLSSCAT
ncbi:MAG: hypothetical protein OXC53_02835 [Rhodobacteraceae bacterium]|nr:hypothetical protein [Gammaproteobacteria bacterium]MCY4326513.1 hypothetical protein [Paracoccaceae bacterium]